MRKMVFLIALVMLIAPYPLHAQLGSTEPITITLSPEYPKPYQTVTVRPNSSLIDLTASAVTVTANGTVVSKGSGSTPVNITLGGPGSLTTVRISAVYEGKTYTEEIRIRPADVALVVEPLTTSHPFYRGGTGVASEGQLRLVAFADLRNSSGVRIDPSTLVYTWRLGDRILEAQSGIGKSSLSATAPVRFRDTAVSLTVTTPDNAIVAQNQILVAPIDPTVRIYRYDALLGPLFDTALSGSFTMSEDEQTFRAVPYHFTGTPAINWMVNGAESGSDKDITLRASGNGGGTANLIAKVKQAATFALSEAKLSVSFGEKKGLGIFGL